MDDFCRICLKYDASLCFIDDLKWSMLRLSLPGLDLKLISEPKLCNRCFQIINNSYKFLVMAITNEINVQEKFNKTLSKVNLTTFQESTSSAFPVCRLCLRNTTNKVINLYKNEIIHQSLEMIRKMIDSCIGHMNFDITNEPVMCDSCWALLQITCNLRKFCSEIEKRLSIYCRDGKLVCHIKQIINNSSTIDELVNNFYIEPNIDRYVQNFDQDKSKQQKSPNSKQIESKPKINDINSNSVINKNKRTQISCKKVVDDKPQSSGAKNTFANVTTIAKKNQISNVAHEQNDSDVNEIIMAKQNTSRITRNKQVTKPKEHSVDNTSISKQTNTLIQVTEIKQEVEETPLTNTDNNTEKAVSTVRKSMTVDSKSKKLSKTNNESGNLRNKEKSSQQASEVIIPDIKLEEDTFSNDENLSKSSANTNQNKGGQTEKIMPKNLRSCAQNNQVVTAQVQPSSPKITQKEKSLQLVTPKKQRGKSLINSQTDNTSLEQISTNNVVNTRSRMVDSNSQTPKKMLLKNSMNKRPDSVNSDPKLKSPKEQQRESKPPTTKTPLKEKEKSNSINITQDTDLQDEPEKIVSLRSRTVDVNKTPQKSQKNRKTVSNEMDSILKEQNVTNIQQKNNDDIISQTPQKKQNKNLGKTKKEVMGPNENDSNNVVTSAQKKSETDIIPQSPHKNMTNERPNIDPFEFEDTVNPEVSLRKRKSDSDTNSPPKKQKKLIQTSLKTLFAAQQKLKEANSLKGTKQVESKTTNLNKTVDTSVDSPVIPESPPKKKRGRKKGSLTSEPTPKTVQKISKPDSSSIMVGKKKHSITITPENVKEETEEKAASKKKSTSNSVKHAAARKSVTKTSVDLSNVKSESDSEDDLFEDEIATNSSKKTGKDKMDVLDSGHESSDERNAQLQDNDDNEGPSGMVAVGYPCTKCPHKSKSQANLKQHLLLHDTEDKSSLFECKICSYLTKSRPHYLRHMIIHNSENNVTFDCFHCSYKATKKQYLINHMLVHRTAEALTLFSCPYCPYKTKRRSLLKNHKQLHEVKVDSSLQCNLCSFKAKRKSFLTSHMLLHKSEHIFECTECDYKARRKTHLDCHMLTHRNDEFFECYHCGYKAKRKYHLVLHLAIHATTKAFKCELCPYQARRKYHLKVHYQNHNKQTSKDDGRKYTCAQCDHITFNRRLFLIHLAEHKAEKRKQRNKRKDSTSSTSSSSS